jgi:hypothetical protein
VDREQALVWFFRLKHRRHHHHRQPIDVERFVSSNTIVFSSYVGTKCSVNFLIIHFSVATEFPSCHRTTLMHSIVQVFPLLLRVSKKRTFSRPRIPDTVSLLPLLLTAVGIVIVNWNGVIRQQEPEEQRSLFAIRDDGYAVTKKLKLKELSCYSGYTMALHRSRFATRLQMAFLDRM